MIAKTLISNLIPPLKTSDTGEQAISWMQEFNVTHLPIVNNEQFLGLIGEDDIMDKSNLTEPLGNYALSLHRPFVHESAHIYEVMKTAAQLQLSIIPVVTHDEKFVGVITFQNLLFYFSQVNSIVDNGGIIELEINKNDYSLTEIARIVESNEAIILSCYVSSIKNSSKISVTLKLNITDLKHVIATFDRFEYSVSASYQESEYIEQMKDRYDELMKYLNM